MSFTLKTAVPRLFAGFGILALLGGIGLAVARPAHTAGGPIPVTVANTVENHDLDNPARQPVHVATELTGSFGEVTSATLYIVPAGKRLVVGYVSARTHVNSNQNGYEVEISAGDFNSFDTAYFNLVPSAAPYAAASEPVRLYADAGTGVSVVIYPSHGNASDLYVSLTGYLVDTPS